MKFVFCAQLHCGIYSIPSVWRYLQFLFHPYWIFLYEGNQPVSGDAY